MAARVQGGSGFPHEVSARAVPRNTCLNVGKRLFDLLVACLLLVIASPLYFLTVIAVFFGVGNPVLFRQSRVGLHGKTFTFLKFRTMTDACDSEGEPLPDTMRLTPVGRVLRRLSLDELPQLLNVIKGDMSLVGPRPLLTEYLPLYDAYQARRHEARPGITGWAQVNGRNDVMWEERFKLDVWYVDHRSFWLDLRILALTMLHVLQGRGISQAGCATMPRFTGSHRNHG